MPTNIIRSEIRFRNNIDNSPFLGVGGYTNNIRGAVGMQYYIEQYTQLSWDSGYIDPSNWSLENDPNNSNILRRSDGGSFITDGFSVGERAVFYTVVRIEINPILGSVYAVRLGYTHESIITSVSDDVIVFNSNINTQNLVDTIKNTIPVNDAYITNYYDCVLMGAEDITGFEIGYSLVENNEKYSGVSLIDGTKTAFYTNEIGSQSNLIPFNSSVKSNTTNRESASIVRAGKSDKIYTIDGQSLAFDVIQNFNIYQIIEIPDYIESWYSNYLNGTVPTELLNGNSLKYTCNLQFYTDYTNKDSVKGSIFESEKGNIGWINELYNGGENQYEVVSISYTNKNGDPIDTIDIGGCNFELKLKSSGFPFSTSNSYKRVFCLRHVVFKNAEDYENNSDYYNQNLLTDRAYVSYGETSNGSSLIKNLESKAIDNYNTTITGEIDFSTFQSEFPNKIPNEGDYYLFGVYASTNNIILGTSSADTEVEPISSTDQIVYLSADINTYIKNTDVSGLWLHDRFEIFDHPTLTSAEGYTGFSGWIEDGIVVFAKKSLKRGAFIESIKLASVAEKQSDKSYFIIDEYNLDLSSQSATIGYTNIDVDQVAGYNLNSNDQFNRLKISQDVDLGVQYINLYIPYKIPWQSWQRLNTADTVFYENNPQNENGLNKNTSRYSGEEGYEVKLYLIANIEYEGVVTEYIDRSPSLDVKYYDEPVDFTNQIITESEDAIDLGGSILEDSPTIIKAVFTKTAHGLNINELYGVIRVEPQRALGNGIFEISTINVGYDQSPLKPISGNYASITSDANTITVSCKTDPSLLGSEPYRISAKLGAKESAPLSGDYNQDYNNDYDNL